MTTNPKGPMFKWFGSKWLASARYPFPETCHTVVEPFAGSASYSLRYSDGRAVTLAETDPHLLSLWRWLISEATLESVHSIPLGLEEGTDIRSVPDLSDGQRLLLKSWQRTNNVGDCWTVSPWGNKPGQWTASTRQRVASQLPLVSDWSVWYGSAFEVLQEPLYKDDPGVHWFVDPPYQFNYQYRQATIDYRELAKLVQAVAGSVVVCEAMGPDGEVPDWIPFEHSHKQVNSRRAEGRRKYSRELIWTKDCDDKSSRTRRAATTRA